MGAAPLARQRHAGVERARRGRLAPHLLPRLPRRGGALPLAAGAGALRRGGAVAAPGAAHAVDAARRRCRAAAQAAAVVVLLAIIFWPPAPKRYQALSDPERSVAVSPLQRQVRVVFTPTTTEAELRHALLEVHGEVVAGPTPFGAYTIAVPAGAGAEPLPLVLEHLRADPHVRFAEPVAGGGQ